MVDGIVVLGEYYNYSTIPRRPTPRQLYTNDNLSERRASSGQDSMVLPAPCWCSYLCYVDGEGSSGDELDVLSAKLAGIMKSSSSSPSSPS